ncbi:MAG: hypothetical protein DDT31_01827 [Syntrophomonadaceae bacterium]|nr:hypothetical protein [Bacillota bacterium]
MKWKGRFSWDWHANVDFLIGYTPAEREKLIDIFMSDFKLIFGYYPESVGSWLIDAHSLRYLSDRYGITASCNCKDQWGTDGYTLWGGYCNQAYYPSYKNVFTPAQSDRNQIPVPIFRMLGSDPIYQYDAGLFEDEKNKDRNPRECQPVVTLEPVLGNFGGGCPEWVRWYFKENFSGICLSFGYAQAGQENSFGWPAMAKGLTDQVKLISEKAEKGELKVETLRDSGKWFKSQYEVTPASAVAALSDWKNLGHRSVWHYSRFYRINLFWEGSRAWYSEGVLKFWIRDIHLFDESYPERYHSEICTGNSFIYDNLPVMDGNRWSDGSVRAGIYPVEILPNDSTTFFKGKEPVVKEVGKEGILMSWPLEKGGELNVLCQVETVKMWCCNVEERLRWGLKILWSKNVPVPIVDIEENLIQYRHNNYQYQLYAGTGYFSKTKKENIIFLHPGKEGCILLILKNERKK